MNITDYIVADFKPLTLQCTIKKALRLCKDFPITHIPIVENNRLLGCFAREDIQSIENNKQPLSNFSDLFLHFHTDISAMLIDVFQIFAENDTNIVPVINQQHYIGYYELNAVLDIFASTPFLASDGFHLIVEKNNKEYAMSEVAQIIESNNGNLLGGYISKKNSDITQLTLKISSDEINEIIQTFRRYNYAIITELKDDDYLEELKSRADYLQKYLNT